MGHMSIGLMARLPETAPFSSAQRAWLDGFLAGYLNAGGDTLAAMPGSPALSADTALAGADENDGDLPWHDPVLPLDERMDLAAGRRPALQLMAAMAHSIAGNAAMSARPMPRRSRPGPRLR